MQMLWAVASSTGTAEVNPIIRSFLSEMVLDLGPFPSVTSAISLSDANAVSVKALDTFPPGVSSLVLSRCHAVLQPSLSGGWGGIRSSKARRAVLELLPRPVFGTCATEGCNTSFTEMMFWRPKQILELLMKGSNASCFWPVEYEHVLSPQVEKALGV